MSIRLMIVDDQALVRQGLKMFLQLDADIEIVGEAENGQQAVERAVDAQPTLILLDLLMPVMGGIAATRALRHQLPDVQIIALTSIQDDQLLQEGILAGVDCYVPKTISPDKLLGTIKAIGAGQVLLPAALIEKRLPDLNLPPPSSPLTPDEIRIIQLLAASSTTVDILQQLKLNEAAYRTSIKRLQEKCAVSSPLLVVLSAMKSGLIPVIADDS